MFRQSRNAGIKWDKVVYINERAEGKDKDTFRFLFIEESLSILIIRLMIDKQKIISITKFIIDNYALFLSDILIFIKIIFILYVIDESNTVANWIFIFTRCDPLFKIHNWVKECFSTFSYTVRP
jgi:hypothetical protein